MRRIGVVTLPFMLLSVFFAHAEDLSSKKAEFLVDLVDNLEWKTAKGVADTETVDIYIIGDSPISAKIKEAASGNKHPFNVKVVAVEDDVSGADIVFLSTDDLGQLAKILKKVNGTSVVTVSDAKDFARYGVMINFMQESGSDLKFEVNKMVMGDAGVELSQELLKKAVII